jgi:hypothetical protein
MCTPIQSILCQMLGFDDGSRAIQQMVSFSSSSRHSSVAVDDYYEIFSIAAQISQLGYKRIAIQFPDELLGDAPLVTSRLQVRVRRHFEVCF